MKVGTLYRLKRGNQDQTVGLIVKGDASSVQVLGSQSRPYQLSEMVDCNDANPLTVGPWSFYMLPEYVYFTGAADSIEIVGMSHEDLKTTFI